MWRFALLATALLAGCSSQTVSTSGSLAEDVGAPRPIVDPVGIRPIPEIPRALRGCWDSPAPLDPDEPGAAHRMIVTRDTIALEYAGSDRQVAAADFVTRVGPTIIEGRFSAPGTHGPSTVATSLSLLDGDTLRRAEGDAGSAFYSRCPASGGG